MTTSELELHPDLEYKRYLEEGRFMIQRCLDSGNYFFYPRVAEPGTGSTNLEWVEASGRGVVHSTSVVRKKPPATSYNVALIDLEEGPRLMSRVEGIAPESVTIGMAVKAEIIEVDDAALLVFRPSSSTGIAS